MADKKKILKKMPDGSVKEIDMGIYADLSKAGIATLDKMLNQTAPQKKKKTAVKKTAKK